MAELHSGARLEPDAHMLLDQPLLRLPLELLRRNLKAAQRHVEQASKAVQRDLRPAAPPPAAAAPPPAAAALAALDAALARAHGLKRKLQALADHEQALHRQQRRRIEHLHELHHIPALADVKYDVWAHTRLDRLLVDYLLRQGYARSARELAAADHLRHLVDVDVFADCARIEASLARGRTHECLAWCSEHRQPLKKMGSTLEFELRLQQFVELARSGSQVEALVHARKHLAGEQGPDFALKAAGLLAHPSHTPVEPYREMYSRDRYARLAAQFVKTHHEIFALPAQSLLHLALSAGLSALKTPSCHSPYALHANANTGAPVCPICSTELNELARNVPYAHHTKSHIEDDPVVLPNGRVFGRERLRRLNETLGTRPGRIRDPTDMDAEWDESVLKKVYIS